MDTVQAQRHGVTPKLDPCVVEDFGHLLCHINLLFVSFALIITLPSTFKVPQITALKTFLVTCGLKVKTLDLDQCWEEVIILASWISLKNMWNPDLWMSVIFQSYKDKV